MMVVQYFAIYHLANMLKRPTFSLGNDFSEIREEIGWSGCIKYNIYNEEV